MDKKKKPSISKILQIVLLTLTHIAVIVAIALSFQYYAIYPSIFCSLVAIVICILIIVDIMFFIGFNHEDKPLKIISLILSGFIFLGGTVGSYVLLEVNGVVDNILDGGNSKYEKVNGVFVSFDKSIDSLEMINGKRVGFLVESQEGVTSAAKQILDDAKYDYAAIDCETNFDLLQSLSDHDIDVAVFNAGYKAILSADESYDYSKFLEKCNDFYIFEKDIEVNVQVSNKDISKEPFNILLIGWSRVEWYSQVGLADAIIVATVNPQTYTVSMTSIARDSYVPISCYGGKNDKINSGRSTSRACFIETVEDLVGMEMDFYMEADYDAIILIVDAIGGIEITNPVAFNLDGWDVPAGTYVANGGQVLQFCRERHAFAEGDFARQQHQKEVILAVARKFVESGDVTMALSAMKAAGGYLTTDLSLNQLTSMFNMILNTKNYTGLDTFDLIDFQTLRIQGYASWTYSYSYGFPLWIYKLYDGSVKECIEHINYVLGDVNTSDQKHSFVFSINNPYVRPSFISASFDEQEEHEVMPPMFPHLTNMTYSEALEWANKNGVTLKAEFILPGDTRYDPELDGTIIDQSPSYGALLADYNTGTITVMGTGDTSNLVPSFTGKSIWKVWDWAREKGFNVQIEEWVANSDLPEMGLVVSQDIDPYTSIDTLATRTIKLKVNDGYPDTSKLVKEMSKSEVLSWANESIYYDPTIEGSGMLKEFSSSEKKFSSADWKFVFENKPDETKQYSELSDEEKSKATFEWNEDDDKAGTKGACIISYDGKDIKSVTCQAYQNVCGEHYEKDGNGACRFVPYSIDNSSTCPEGFAINSTENIGTVGEEGTEINRYYTVSYIGESVGACKLYIVWPESSGEQ